MKPTNPVYNYSIEKEADYSKITYKKTPISFGMVKPLCYYMAIPAFILMMVTRPTFTPSPILTGAILWVVWMLALSFGIMLLINSLRGSGKLKIGNTNIISGNKTFDLEHVSSILIKDPAGRYTSSSTVVVMNNNPFSMAGSIANVGTSIGVMANESRAAIQKYIKEANYKICIRYGSKDITIASGLGETDAEVLFDKIINIAGYSKSQ